MISVGNMPANKNWKYGSRVLRLWADEKLGGQRCNQEPFVFKDLMEDPIGTS